MLSYRLLLVDGHGEATTAPLHIRTLREFPGRGELSVHFRPVRNDFLFESAKIGGQLGYRILAGEGVVRSQLWVEYEVGGDALNVMGRSSDLLFALALVTAKWKIPSNAIATIAATGVLDGDGRVQETDKVPEKMAAAVRDVGTALPGLIFYPTADAPAVESWQSSVDVPANVRLQPVEHLDEALAYLGYALEKVYLRNPFQGLKHYEYRHRTVFFGRDRETQDVVELLLRREQAGASGVLVEGASGSGKSSFLQAGVLPALLDGWSLPDAVRHEIRRRPVSRGAVLSVWRPGFLSPGSDEAGLAKSVRDCWGFYPEFDGGPLDESLDTLAQLAAARRASWPAACRFVWVIDQLEELLNLRISDSLIEAFGRFLAEVQTDGGWTLGSIRADAVPRFKEFESMRRVFGANEGQYYLASVEGTALDDVIKRPASAAGLTFGMGPDGRRLDDLLREDAYLERGSLPALQFTLDQLYMQRVGHELSYAAYRQLGGIRGSIAITAASVLEASAPAERNALPRLFRHLVSVDDQAQVTRRFAPIAEVALDGPAQRVLQRLVTARLCVTDQRDGKGVVSFAHDTLLQTLPALTEWLKKEAGLLQARHLAQREADLWAQHAQSDAWLAGADKLIGFSPLEAAGISLPPLTREFIVRSARRAQAITRIKQAAITLITGLAVVASLAGWIATKKQREAEYQTARTLEAQSRLLTETAATRLNEGALSYARGIILEVLSRAKSLQQVDAAAINVLQEVRAYDPQVAVLSGHTNAVRRAAYSPDGTQIVTTSLDRTARLWDARTGTQVAVLAGHKHAVMCADFSPDGARVITASDSVRVWDAHTGVLLSTVAVEDDGFSTAFYSPDGQTIVTASRDVALWDASSGHQIRRIHRDATRLHSAAYSRDGKFLVVVSDDRQARVLDARTGVELTVLTGHSDDLNSAFFSSDGAKIVTAANDSTARIYDARTGAILKVLSGNTGQVWDAHFSPDGTQVVTVSTDKNARVFDAATGMLLRMLSGHKHIVTSARYSPDGQFILTTGYDGTARIWDARVGPATMDLIHQAPVMQVAYSPEGSRLLTASEEEAAQLWDSKSGRAIAVLPGHHGGVSSARYSPDGHSIVTAAGDGARIWDAGTGSLVHTLPNQGGFASASYAPDGLRIVTSAEDMTARIWDARTLTQLALFKGHTNSINSVMFSPDGTKILTASVDKSVRIWDAQTGVQLKFLPHPDMLNAAAYSPDGTRIVTASEDKLARIWDAQSGNLLRVLLGHHGRIFDAAFSPDGRHVVTAARDNTVRIWDVNSGEELAALPGHEARVVSVAYSPDGTHIASASIDKTARIWDATIPADLPSQMIWEQAAESDPMTVLERTQLGLVLEEAASPVFTHSSDCDRNAAAYYDPDRQAPGVMLGDINADIALPACTGTNGETPVGRQRYQAGRAYLAKGDFARAKNSFEAALAQGYRAAAIDLGDEQKENKSDIYNPMASVAEYERAWRDGVPIAAFKLGELYELGASGRSGVTGGLAPDRDKAWAWYEKGGNAGEPNALGRMARRSEEKALKDLPREAIDADLLMAFRLYALAAEQASKARWPDDAWKHWRYRRSTLARFLAREGMMQPVANAFREVLAKSGRRRIGEGQ
jgi:WD40 repeat protein